MDLFARAPRGKGHILYTRNGYRSTLKYYNIIHWAAVFVRHGKKYASSTRPKTLTMDGPIASITATWQHNVLSKAHLDLYRGSLSAWRENHPFACNVGIRSWNGKYVQKTFKWNIFISQMNIENGVKFQKKKKRKTAIIMFTLISKVI